MRKAIMGIGAILMIICMLFASCGDCKGQQGLSGKTYVSVTFRQQGEEDKIIKVVKGGALADVPAPKPKTGYTVVWERTDFDGLESDLVVNAKETANTYKIVLDFGYHDVTEATELHVEYDKDFTLPLPTDDEATVIGWVKKGTNEEVKSGTYKFDGNMELEAVWKEPEYTGRH